MHGRMAPPTWATARASHRDERGGGGRRVGHTRRIDTSPPPPPFPESLCHRCAHLRLVESGKGSVFLMCREPSLPKYPRQPVAACARFTPVGDAPG